MADLEEKIAEAEPQDAGTAAKPTGADPIEPAHRPLPAALPRDVVEHAAPCDDAGACAACGGALRALGEDVTELLDRRRFASQAEARVAWFSYIEGWYNPVHLHFVLNYRSQLATSKIGKPSPCSTKS